MATFFNNIPFILMFMYMSLFNMLMSSKTLRVFGDVATIGISYNGGSTIAVWTVQYVTCQYGSSKKALKRFTPVQCTGRSSLLSCHLDQASRYDCRHAAYLMTSDPETI